MRQNHAVLVAHPLEQKAPLRAINRDLPYQLIENLLEELFADLANAVLPRVLPVERVLQLLLQVDDIDLGRGLR